MSSSIFFDFSPLNSTTWYYAALLLAVGLFFQFARPFSLRNWDLLGLFLMCPGFLLVQEANERGSERERLVGYLWLMGGTLFWFVRCLVDLATIKRPLISPNLSQGGLIWLGSALFVGLTVSGFARSTDPWEQPQKRIVTEQFAKEGPSDVRYWIDKSVAPACHLAVVVGLVMIGYQQFNDLATGFAAGVMYLLVPYTGFQINQVAHVWPAAMLTWAIYCYRRPTLAGGLIGLAAGTTFFPVLLLPVWVQFYRAKGTGRFLLSVAISALVGFGMALVLSEFGLGYWPSVNASDWQPWRVPHAESVWTGAHWAYRLPVFIAYAGFVLTAVIWPPVRNLGHLNALSAAVLLGIQFWYADRGGLYVLWYAPMIVLVVVRPNLSEMVPVPPGPPPAFVRWAWGKVRPIKPAETSTAIAA